MLQKRLNKMNEFIVGATYNITGLKYLTGPGRDVPSRLAIYKGVEESRHRFDVTSYFINKQWLDHDEACRTAKSRFHEHIGLSNATIEQFKNEGRQIKFWLPSKNVLMQESAKSLASAKPNISQKQLLETYMATFKKNGTWDDVLETLGMERTPKNKAAVKERMNTIKKSAGIKVPHLAKGRRDFKANREELRMFAIELGLELKTG